MNKVTLTQAVEITPASKELFVLTIVHGASPDKKRPFLAGIDTLNDRGIIFVGAFTSKQLARAAAVDRAILHIEGPILVDEVEAEEGVDA